MVGGAGESDGVPPLGDGDGVHGSVTDGDGVGVAVRVRVGDGDAERSGERVVDGATTAVVRRGRDRSPRVGVADGSGSDGCTTGAAGDDSTGDGAAAGPWSAPSHRPAVTITAATGVPHSAICAAIGISRRRL